MKKTTEDTKQSEWKQGARIARMNHRFLEITNENDKMEPLLEQFIEEVRSFTDCPAIGIRLINENGSIPYMHYIGYSERFFALENPLSIHRDHCMCTRVITGDIDPDLSCYTKNGSFHINGTSRFLASVPREQRGETRNVCNEEGYESVAVVPIRVEGRIIGLIHMADPREDMFTAETISILEASARQLGSALPRVMAAEKLRKSEEKFRTLTETTSDWVWEVDAECVYTYANPQVKNMLGYEVEEVLGKKPFDLMPADEAMHMVKIFKENLANRKPFHGLENVNMHKDGHRVVLETSGVPIFGLDGDFFGFRGIDRDITERKRAEVERHRLEEYQARSQKLESLIAMAGGIAHDFNNLLMGVLGNTNLALNKLPPKSPLRKYLVEIDQSAVRAAELSRQMLTYSGHGKLEVESIDMSVILEEAASQIRGLVHENVELAFSPAQGLPRIDADVSQIRQALLCLAINAAEAIGDKAGEIRISTGAMTCDRDFLGETNLDEQMTEGPYVFVEVGDTGIGMDGQTQEKIFDPFFSTKFMGRGLGLAAVYGIVRGHRGTVRVHSEPGQGATFKILFPAKSKGDGRKGVAQGADSRYPNA